EAIIHVFHARAAMLRHDFDDATCGELIRSTMAAYLRPGESRFDRMAEAVERSYSKASFVLAFCNGKRRIARAKGVDMGPDDFARIAVTAPFVIGRLLAVQG